MTIKSCFFTLFLTIFSASVGFAETASYTIEGMTCGSCVKHIQNDVCKKIEGLEKCDVKVGSLIMTTKPGGTIDTKKVESMVSEAGYKVIKSEIK